MEKWAIRPEDFEFKEGEMALRSTISLKKGNFIDFCDKLNGFDEAITPEESTCAKRRKVKIVKLQTTFSFKYLVSENCHLPKPRIWFSPKSIGELDIAAIKLQKVYKGYRTRRNLADCAIVCEELWRKVIDFAALSRGSISHLDKSETAASKWARAGTMAAKVGKGLSKDDKGQKLALRHWLEAIDSRHRYGHNLHFYYVVWFHSQSFQPFFYWLDIGDGKELNLEKCPRIELQRQCITYLGPKEREAYEVTVDSGMLVYRQNRALVHTPQGSKWIFVLSTSRTLYIGEKKKGLFQHSSFLAGGATIASGRLVAYNGLLDAIWPYSGHYCPTEKNLMEFVSFLEEHNVDLTNVKKYATDDDVPPSEPFDEGLNLQCEGIEGNVGASEKSVAHFGTNVEAASQVKESKPLSTKWTTGAGPRIACVREYPTKLQVQALEQLNLSPKTIPGKFACKTPIPHQGPVQNFISPLGLCIWDFLAHGYMSLEQ